MSRFLLPALLLAAAPACAQEPANLLPNGDFQLVTDGAPDKWPAAKGSVSYPLEGENRFLHLQSEKPGQMVMSYRQVAIPADVKALELTWKHRVTDLKRGKELWFDARIMFQWLDAAGAKVAGAPSPPYAQKNTDGWVERSKSFLVPEGARILAIMPTLFQVQKGSYDLDDFVLKPTDPGPIAEAKKAHDEARAEQVAKITDKRQTAAAAKAGPDGELIPNGDFQLDADADGIPDKWGKLKEGSNLTWEKEADNTFLRLKSPEAGKMVLFYRAQDVPKDAKALELKWKERLANFKRGKENYHDARIMIQWLGAGGQKVPGAPAAPAARKDTEGWVEKSKSFLVPEGALTFVMMPCLFQVASGTYDLDEISLMPTDPAPLLAAGAEKAEAAKAAFVAAEEPKPATWPEEIHTEGTRTLTKAGKEIILRGVNVDSLEWNPRGEQVMKSALVALDEWKSNCIRLPIRENYWFGRDATQKDGGKAYRELVDNIVILAANRGAYTMLDLHRFRAPKAEHVEFWRDVATKYKNHPAVIFELFNEPHGTSWEVWRNGGFVAEKAKAADEDNFLNAADKAKNANGFQSVGMQALVDAVRGTGAKNIVIAGGLDWAYDLSGVMKGFALDEKGGNGLMYATHIYAGKRDWKGKVLAAAEKYPIMVSELGANTKKMSFIPAEAQENAETWVPRVLGFIQQHKFNWTAFSLHPASAPVLISDWKYTPTPEWGALAKRALSGEQFPAPTELR